MRSDDAPTERNPGLRTYFAVSSALSAWGVLLYAITRHSGGAAPAAQRVIGPMVALAALTAFVWLLMVLLRNYAILSGLSSVAYYVDYKSRIPEEWIERPARTFNNLMQVPTLFYVVCILMLVSGHIDRAQVALAWAFLAARVAHACVYIALNHVPTRFGCWVASCIALGVIWVRFAEQTWQLWW